MSGHHHIGWITLWLASAAICAGQAIPVRPANPIRPRPALTILGGLSLSTSATTLNFNLSPGAVSNAPSTVVTTSWTALAVGTIAVDIYGYLSSTSAALQNTVNGTYVIPASAVSGQVSGTGSLATSFTPFTQTTPAPASSSAGLHLVSTSVTIVVVGTGSLTNSLALQINLAPQPQLPAGTYTGTLTLIAVAN